MISNETNANKNQITSEKVNIQGRLFRDFWFTIPEYQRSYVWDSDNISDLLDDLWFAYENKNDAEYFLGSLVLKELSKKDYKEYEVLDGQQRLTTLFLLLAVIRDLNISDKLNNACQDLLYQEENEFKRTPERMRIVFKIRDDVGKFVKEIIVKQSGTLNITELENYSKFKNTSIVNMVNAVNHMKDFFASKNLGDISNFTSFLLNEVIFIYVSTANREDAFRLFNILNNRGIPLSNADILKSINIGVIQDNEKQNYALTWETIEGEIGTEDFDRFLSLIRTIKVKEKARKNLLEEFEENIYKKNLLNKGKETIDCIKKYKDIYDKLINLNNLEIDCKYKNLITIMNIGIPSNEWIPPLLRFYEKFNETNLLEFLIKLEFKFSGDWILGESPTSRIENINDILKKIDLATSTDEILNDSGLFYVNQDQLNYIFNSDVYGRKFTRYVLLKHEFLMSDNTVHLASYNNISVEHVLPQTPDSSSNWVKIFNEDDRKQWTHKLANLILLSRKKNSSLSNLDFTDKKQRYLKSGFDIFKGSYVFLDQNENWTIELLKTRQNEIINLLCKKP